MKLYRAFFTVGGLTLVSRILGFARDVIFAALLGAGPVSQAFVVAFRFPNLFRRWFGEGAFNSAFVPLFARRLQGEGQDAARRFAEDAMAGLTFVLVLLSAAAMIAMPWLMFVLAPGFAADPAKFDLAVVMSRIAFPYLLCMSLVALLSGVLNTLGRFWESASISIVLNITLIAAMGLAALLGHRNDAQAGLILAWGVFAAGVLQLLLLADGVRRAGMRLKLRRPVMNEGTRELVRLGLPGIVAGGATQINIVIGGVIASLQDGAVSWLFYADRLYELPLAIIGIAIGVVLLPDVSRHLKAGNDAAVMDSQNRSLELALLLTLPAAVALAVVPMEFVGALFERGAFTARDTVMVSLALAFFALGLPAFVMIKVFSPAFFAREDTRTPMRYAVWSLILNTAGSLALFFAFQAVGWPPHVGIAIATTIGGWLNALLLLAALLRRGYYVPDARLKRALVGVLASSLVLAVVLWALAAWGPAWLAALGLTGGAGRMALAALLVFAGAAVYFATAFMTGALKPAILRSAFQRRT